jgi:putative DNA primase/helicase
LDETLILTKKDNQLLYRVNHQYEEFFSLDNWDIIERLVNYNCTDAGNAELFRDIIGKKFWYVPECDWFYFDGVKYVQSPEKAQLAMLAIARARAEAALLYFSNSPKNKQMGDIIKWGLSSESNSKIKGALEIAKTMLTKHFTEFDKNPLLLCVKNGVYDLRLHGDGFRQAMPEDFLHRCTNVEYKPGAECPRWEQFQQEITCNDEDMIRFKQKAYGYSLTGKTTEQCLFLCWGGGANGKSTELGVAEKLMGGYALSTPSSTFKEQYGNDSIPNDIARMAGMRLVKTIEIKEGVRLNEERIKSLTGGDRISARFLHREWFDYWPEYKLWLATNHKPIIKGTDEAIWRRIRLIPFEAHFPPEKRDPNLLDTLQSELPGILNWAIEGCYFWQREGLKPIDKIKQATNEYRIESDVIERFLYERVKKVEGTTLKANLLYKNYQNWCDESGEKPVNSTDFGLRMKEKGFRKEKKGVVVYYDIQIAS